MSDSLLVVVNGDLTEAREKYIAHQCNCTTKTSKGLAHSIFTKFPYANVYKNRESFGATEPGNIIVCGNGEDKRYVINMMAQITGGKPKKPETFEIRAEYFQQCLDQIKEIPNLESIAFPFNIGCGLAKGNWPVYEKMLSDFAEEVKVPVVLYKYEEQK